MSEEEGSKLSVLHLTEEELRIRPHQDQKFPMVSIFQGLQIQNKREDKIGSK